MMTLQQLVENGNAKRIRCPSCRQVFTIKAHMPGGNGQWQRGQYGEWYHWHQSGWEPCEVVRDSGACS